MLASSHPGKNGGGVGVLGREVPLLTPGVMEPSSLQERPQSAVLAGPVRGWGLSDASGSC